LFCVVLVDSGGHRGAGGGAAVLRILAEGHTIFQTFPKKEGQRKRSLNILFHTIFMFE